jgi:hypothetical protein
MAYMPPPDINSEETPELNLEELPFEAYEVS